MSWLSNLLHPGRGYDAAQDKLGQGWNQAQDFFNKGQGLQQPFQQAGVDQIPGLSEAIKKLMNPADLQNEWSKGYETSPYAQQLMEGAKTEGLDAASSMGLMGSSAALGNIQNNSTNLMNADRQQYLQDLMQKYMTGIQGSQNLLSTGATTAGNMANQNMQMGTNAMNNAENMAGLEYGKQNAGSNMLKQIMGMIGGGATDYLTGGMGKGSYGRGAWAPSWMT